MKSIAILLLISSCSGKPENTLAHKPEVQSKDDFQVFWSQFREYILSRDTSGIISLTRFPIETRGSLDSDPTIFYNKREFIPVFNRFLTQLSGSNTTNLRETEFELIQRTSIPSSLDRQSGRVGNMIFGIVDGEWRLVFLYIQLER